MPIYNNNLCEKSTNCSEIKVAFRWEHLHFLHEVILNPCSNCNTCFAEPIAYMYSWIMDEELLEKSRHLGKLVLACYRDIHAMQIQFHSMYVSSSVVHSWYSHLPSYIFNHDTPWIPVSEGMECCLQGQSILCSSFLIAVFNTTTMEHVWWEFLKVTLLAASMKYHLTIWGT